MTQGFPLGHHTLLHCQLRGLISYKKNIEKTIKFNKNIKSNLLPFQRSRLASLAPASCVSDGAIKERNLHWPNTKNAGFNTSLSFNIE